MDIPCHAVSGFFSQKMVPASFEKISNIYACPLPRVYALFLFAIEYSAKAQPPQHTTTGPPPHSMANRKIAFTLGRGFAYISDMSSTSGYMGAKYVQEFCPSVF